MQTDNPLTIRGRYTLHCLIGKGAFAKVWKAADEVTGGFVALKQLEPKGKKKAVDQGFIKEVMSEINLLSKLNHSNIVKYRGCFLEQNYLYIILELVDFGSLQTLIKQYDDLGENVVACYIYQILLGLKYLHEQGIIHKDIKAANILMTSSGLCKLTDFGLSQRLQDVDPTVVEGSPYWLAPEVINEEGVSTKSDVWSLGATMIELLTKKPPFHNLTGFAAMYNIATLTEMPLPPNISPECADFLSCCFKIDPHERHSCAELLNHPWLIKNANSLMRQKQLVGPRESAKLTLTNNMLPPPKGFSLPGSPKESSRRSSRESSTGKDVQALPPTKEPNSSTLDMHTLQNPSYPKSTSPKVSEKPLSKSSVRHNAGSSAPQFSSLTHDTLATRLETVRTRRLERDFERSESLFGADPLINIQTDSILSINSDSDDLTLFPDIQDLSDDNKYNSLIGTMSNDILDVSCKEPPGQDSVIIDGVMRHTFMSNILMTPKINKKAIKQHLRILEKNVFASYSIIDAHKLLKAISTSQKRKKLSCIFRGHMFPQKQQEAIADGSGGHQNPTNGEEDPSPFLPYELDLESLQPTETAGVLISNIMEKRGFLSVIQHIDNILINIENSSLASSMDHFNEVCVNLNNLYNTHPIETSVLKNKLKALRERQQNYQGLPLTTPRDQESTHRTKALYSSNPDADSNQSSTASGYDSIQMSFSTLKVHNTASLHSPAKPSSRGRHMPSSYAAGMQKTSMVRPQYHSLTNTLQSNLHSSSLEPLVLKKFGELGSFPESNHSLLDEALPSKSTNVPFLGAAQEFFGKEFDEKYYLNADLRDRNNKSKRGDPKAAMSLATRRAIFWNAALTLYMYEYCIELCKILYVLCQYSPRLIMNLTALGLPPLMKRLIDFKISNSITFVESISDFFRAIKSQTCEAVNSESRGFKFMRHSQDAQTTLQNDTISTARSGRVNGQFDSGTTTNQKSQIQHDTIRSLDCHLTTHLFLTYTTLKNQNTDDKYALKSFLGEFKATADRTLLAFRSFTYSSLPINVGADRVSEKDKERPKYSARKGTKDYYEIIHSTTVPARSYAHLLQLPNVPRFSCTSKTLENDHAGLSHYPSMLTGRETPSIVPTNIPTVVPIVDKDTGHTNSSIYGEDSCVGFQIDPSAADSSQKLVSYPCDKDALINVLQGETRTVVSDLLQVFIDGNFASAEFISIDYCLILHSQILQLCDCLLSTKDARFVIQVIGIIYKLVFKDKTSKARKVGILNSKFLTDEREVLDHVVKLYQLDSVLPSEKAVSTKNSRVGSTSAIQPAKSIMEIPTISTQSYATILITENAYEYIAKSLNILLFWKLLPPILEGSPYNYPTCEVQVIGQRVDWNNPFDLDLSGETSDRLRSIFFADKGKDYNETKLKYYLSILAMNEKRIQALEQGIEVYTKLVDLDYAHIIFSKDVLKTYINFISCVLMSCLPASYTASPLSNYSSTSLPYRIHTIVTTFFASLRKFVLTPDFVQSLTSQTIDILVDLLINIQNYRTDDILDSATYLCHSIIQFPEIHAIALNKGLIPVCYRIIYGSLTPVIEGDASRPHSQRSSPRKPSKKMTSQAPEASSSYSPSPITEFSGNVVELAMEIILRTSALRPTKRFPNQQKRQNRLMVPYQSLLEKIFKEFSTVEDGREQWLSKIFNLAATYPNKVLCLLSWFFDCSKYSHIQQSWRRIINVIVSPANLAKLSVLLSTEKIASEVIGDLTRFIKQHESIPQFLSSDQQFLQRLFVNLRASKQNTTRKGCMDIFEHIYLHSSHPRQLITRYNIRKLMIVLSYERPATENGTDGHARTALAMKAQTFLTYIQSFELMQ
ncbi:Kinase, STE STE11 [Giardia duodenalis]|uniref:Kinase, STE STE11 n=1 Tax=Giardia intestinalis (strain ATCC 50803 / WB clone C6) TaxID=184922 RepID=A8B7B0_GIAIC|nr:Kinase, STE STE11 [Giardia intestinalis]KAE8301743.1 Kinase, STE STE11 [Giardia intestinalis]|eukprot:XP_001709184.1 Kinase, STE Dicty2 [Giardia lamblia ATCC 50803]